MHDLQIYREDSPSPTPINGDTDNMNNMNNGNILKDLELPCLEFLKTKRNYIVFAEYLAHVFALENLLYVGKVNILYQTVYKLQKDFDKNKPAITEKNKHIERVKFIYLENIYKDYKNKIEEWGEKNIYEEDSFESYHKAIHGLCIELYNEFISTTAFQPVNISYEQRKELESLIKDESTMNKFESYNDYLHIFDDSLVEIYSLLISSYSFKFKQYCKNM